LLGFDPRGGQPRLETFFQRVHPEDQAKFREMTQTALREKVESELDYRIVHPGGEIRDIHVVGHPVLSPSGDLVEFVGTVIDVTERKQAEAALGEAQTKLAHVMRITTLGELTASIAHEVNQPLTGVVTYGDACLRWLDREVPRIDQARSAVAQMIGSARHASDVIARIRALSKKGALETAQLNINEIIDHVIPLIRREIDVHGVSLRLDLGSSLPPADGDRIQLQQVVMNLLMNGIQAMNPVTGNPRELRIRSREHGPDQILVAVEDSGTGIELENVDQVFKAFFTTKPDGMGMGLSICRSIIEQHGGRIWASRNSGPGSTFEFTLRISKRGTVDEPACAEAREYKKD
jgi:signal transduction histidine kinase